MEGVLAIFFIDGFAPKRGDILGFLEVGGLLDADAMQFVLPNLLPGFEYESQFPGGTFALVALNDAQLVPEHSTVVLLPPALWLLGGALAFLGAQRRRAA